MSQKRADSKPLYFFATRSPPKLARTPGAVLSHYYHERRYETYLLAEDGTLLQAGFGEFVGLVDIKAAVHFDGSWGSFAGVRRAGTAAGLPTQPVAAAVWWLQRKTIIELVLQNW